MSAPMELDVADEPRAGLRERKKARTREALQDAAMELFGRQGFDRTTVEEIADACDVSPRTFFRYYPTKEDVLFADSSARCELLLDEIAARPAGEAPFAAIRAAMRRLAADYGNDRDALVARSKVVEASPHLQAYKVQYQAGWQAGIVEALERRAESAGAPARRDDLELLGAVATATLRVAFDSWVAAADAVDLEVVVDRAFARLAVGFAASPTR